MEDTLALIRLLAATSVEESPLARNRDLTEGVEREQIVKEGLVPKGDAAPPADPRPPESVLRPTVRWEVPTRDSGRTADPRPPALFNADDISPEPPRAVSIEGANPETGIPVMRMPAEVKPLEPVSIPPATVMSPETFLGKAATPQILAAIAGSPADILQRQDVQGVAYPTPNNRVTITVPPAFPIDPTEAFSRVDEEMNLPPRPQSVEARRLQVSLPDETDPSEVYVAQSLAANSDSDRQRWVL